MAKKREPHALDRAIQELTKNATAVELLNDANVVRSLKKRLVEAALEAEMTGHLGYEMHAVEGNNTGNSRNGTASERILDHDGQFEIDVPRDRNGGSLSRCSCASSRSACRGSTRESWPCTPRSPRCSHGGNPSIRWNSRADGGSATGRRWRCGC